MAYPTGTPVRESIMDDIVTTLQAIATPSYHHDVAAVHRLQGDGTLDLYELPAVIVAPPLLSWSDDTNSIQRGEMRVTCRVALDDRIDHQQSLSWLMEDVKVALTADVTRGGFARDTNVLTDEPFMSDPSSGIAGGDFQVLVKFAHEYADPNTAA